MRRPGPNSSPANPDKKGALTARPSISWSLVLPAHSRVFEAGLLCQANWLLTADYFYTLPSATPHAVSDLRSPAPTRHPSPRPTDAPLTRQATGHTPSG